jgi:hypothetical protein
MSPLHGLRLNCLLAPLSVALVAVLVLAVAWRWQVGQTAEQERAARSAALAGLARLIEQGVAVEAGTWQGAHRGWTGVARFRYDGDVLVPLATAGVVPVGAEPSPALLLAFQGAQAWHDADGDAVATPCLPPLGPPSVVVGWYAAAPAPSLTPWLLLAGAVLTVGGGLGVYLVARVYRPVMWMEQAALAAAAGQAEPPGGNASAETASLRSSLAMLIDKRKPDDGHA